MKNKLRIIALALGLVLSVSFLASCSDSKGEKTPTKSEGKIEETTEAVKMIDEAEAKEIVFADLSIQESAAEDLTVKFEDNSYVIAFVWSGFDYQYTIDAATGEIAEIMFDGEVL